MLWLLVLLGAPAAAQDTERGAALAAIGGCQNCHTVDDDQPMAGGYAIETKFGTFYGSNLTPDPVHGIGGWEASDFLRAMTRGRSPEGRPYYPAFPYPSFTHMTEADLLDLFAWLQQLAPQPVPNRDHEVVAPYRGLWKMRLWKWVAFQARDFREDPKLSPSENRGRYLVDGLAHCGECHSGRGGLGATRRSRYLAGSDAPPEPSPNITPHADGIGDWSRGDLDRFLRTGMEPDGDFAGAAMAEVIEHGTATLSDADRAAVVDWLLAVPPKKPRGPAPEEDAEDEDDRFDTWD